MEWVGGDEAFTKFVFVHICSHMKNAMCAILKMVGNGTCHQQAFGNFIWSFELLNFEHLLEKTPMSLKKPYLEHI